ncbi:TIGR03936 family radical SAM-associated protein [Clostridium sp. JS66]|uniref:TIGR03936 family radical SAM-associated protein n=1 Tax=Clostridium sp. JS66 TaxID=3064705 RepID=UPI00298E3670|nr:TIGR03936 family radical SAM-associated protein [Clostridium sp. JS66]WPC42897.1 TIGR03936 family radical SAM-associated protein [Clostridium sp. JS66]
MHYLIKFSKESNIKFIGHLDFMRTIQRMIERSELSAEYSKGFNPHVNMSIAQPLAVGVYSSGDYMDLMLEETAENIIVEKLNEVAPSGIKVFDAVKIQDIENKKIFKSMAVIDAAKYIIRIKYKNIESLNEEIEKLLNLGQWNTIKKSKSGEAEVDIKTMIKEFSYKIEDNVLIVETLIACGSRQNLSAELLAKYIGQNTKEANMEAFVDIKREEMYAESEGKLLPLYQFAREREA